MNTQEFAKMCGVEKRTLFHYDDLGLLKPASRLENGYREYALSQMEQMDMIKLLQASGYTLKEIKKIMIGDDAQRRDRFFSASRMIEQKINDLLAMRNYIHKKEALWQQYQAWKQAQQPFTVQNMSITYVQKEIHHPEHYFCFLCDGDYDGSIIYGDGRMFVCRDSNQGISRSGNAIMFFLEAANELPDMMQAIRTKLEQFRFPGEDQYFIHPIPHLMLEDQQQGVVRIIVFSLM